jgi:hypothetical protein
MESGKKGPKGAEDITKLQVTDWCSGFSPDDSATLRLPKNDAGYDVYARALATPTDNPDMTITPELVAAEDEYGNDLMYLGFLDNDGFATPSMTFERKKGKSKAVPITGLFEWTGDVCYFSDAYCGDPDDNDPSDDCETTQLCCTEAGDNFYEDCVLKEDVQVDGLCPEGSTEMTAYCRGYQDEWIFNINDFVTYLWEIDNNGLKLLQIRFYPR